MVRGTSSSCHVLRWREASTIGTTRCREGLLGIDFSRLLIVILLLLHRVIIPSMSRPASSTKDHLEQHQTSENQEHAVHELGLVLREPKFPSTA